MQLSEHFTLEEMVRSQTASRRSIDNTPPASVVGELTRTAAQMEKVRAALGQPVYVTSGFRCSELNIAIGGAPTSAHQSGSAVDFTCVAFGTPYEVAKFLAGSDIKFDQLIYEFKDWVHISFDARMRGQVLTIFNSATGYMPGIVSE